MQNALWINIEAYDWASACLFFVYIHFSRTRGRSGNGQKTGMERVSNLKVKSAYEPSGPSGRSLSRFSWHEATRSISAPPWMGCQFIAGLPAAFRRYPFIHLGGERHRGSKVSCPRTQHNVPGQDPNPDHSLCSRAH